MFVYRCLCACSSPAKCVSCHYTWQSKTPSASSQVWMCTSICIFMFVCVSERDRQDSPMGSMLSLRKADYGTCQGVRNTPYQHYTDSQLSIHLYGCESTAPSPLLPPAIWRVGQVLPPQLDMKLDSYCPHIFSLVNQCLQHFCSDVSNTWCLWGQGPVFQGLHRRQWIV